MSVSHPSAEGYADGMPAPDDETIDRDPRNSEMGDESAMPTEFIDTPHNEPGDQSPPSPEVAEGQDDRDSSGESGG